MKLLVKSFLIITSLFLISCNTENQSVLKDKLNDISDDQKVLLRKIANMEKSIANIASTSNKKPDNKQKPKADPNKVYSAKIGNSFVQGNKNAKVTIIEWADYM